MKEPSWKFRSTHFSSVNLKKKRRKKIGFPYESFIEHSSLLLSLHSFTVVVSHRTCIENLFSSGFTQTLPEWRYLPLQKQSVGRFSFTHIWTCVERLSVIVRFGAQTFHCLEGQLCSEMGEKSQLNKHEKVTASAVLTVNLTGLHLPVFLFLSLMSKTRRHNWKGQLKNFMASSSPE